MDQSIATEDACSVVGTSGDAAVALNPTGHAGDPILQVEDISLSFGGIQALDGVGFDIAREKIFSIIGPNGAGKTSIANVISGVYRPTAGKILFNGKDRTFSAPKAVAELGITRTFQNLALFRGMSVIENILIGRHKHMSAGLFEAAIYWGRARREELDHRRKVEEIIAFLGIEDIRQTPVETLSYGLQKRVELGRALALEPSLLLLDEPMAGMSQEEKRDMVRFIVDVHVDFGTTIVLIEHDMGVVMDISDHVVVLDHGEKISEGPPADVRRDPLVIKAYLGQEV